MTAVGDRPVPTLSASSSMYDDYVIEGLSLYEMHREPHRPVEDDTTTTLPIRILNKDLSCPICLNIIHNTQTVMECLHRFCSGCILKSLRMGKKECPTCRIPCSSRRNLRPDPNFDNLIKVLYPNLEQYEQQEESFIQQINNEYVTKAMRAASVEEGMKRQQQAAKRPREKPADYVKEKKKDKIEKKKESKPKKQKVDQLQNSTPHNNSTAPHTTVASVPTNVLTPPPTKPRQPAPPPQDDVSIAIAPYPGEKILTYLPRPFLRIPAAASVKHVTRFLAMKFPTIDVTGLKVVLGTGVSDSVKFAKREEAGLTVDLPDLDLVISQNKYLSDDTALPTLRSVWKRRDEILLLYFLMPKEIAHTEPPSTVASSATTTTTTVATDPKISIMTVQ